MNQITQNSQGQLAKILATENLRIRHRSTISTASMDIVNRVLSLPIWKDMSPELIDMLTVHEVGHALDTDPELWMKIIMSKGLTESSVYKDIVNIVEDVRIDRRQKRRYPGTNRIYTIAYEELWQRDFFNLGKNGRNVNSLTFVDRLNCYYKGGVTKNIHFSSDEMVMVEQAYELDTLQEVSDFSEMIYKKYFQILKDSGVTRTNLPNIEIAMNEKDTVNLDKKSEILEDALKMQEEYDSTVGKPTKKEDRPEATFDDVDEAMDNILEVDEESLKSDLTDADSDEALGMLGKKSKEEDTRTEEEKAKDHEDFLDRFEEEKFIVPVITTSDAWQENMKNVIDTGYNISYVKMPSEDILVKNFVHDYKRVYKDYDPIWKKLRDQPVDIKNVLPSIYKKMNDFTNKEAGTISLMVKEFLLKKAARESSLIVTTKTGKLDMNKMFSHSYSEDIFKKAFTQPKGQSHGFVILLDWSGSMMPNVIGTINQLLVISSFCRRLNIPFDVYLFRNGLPERTFTQIESDVRFNSFLLRNMISSRMTASEYTTAMMTCLVLGYNQVVYGPMSRIDSMGGTPLNDALLVMPKVINDFRKANNLEVVNFICLTDGGSDALSVSSPQTAAKIILEDTVPVELNYGTRLTSRILKWIGQKTQANIIGFFLAKSYKDGLYPYGIYGENREYAAAWKETGFVKVANPELGYDEYYIIKGGTPSSRLDLSGVNANGTTAAMTKQYIKALENKVNSRLLVKEFIAKVTS